MKRSLLAVFLLLVLAPIGVISWLGYSNIKREQSMTTERYSILATKQLNEIDRLLRTHHLEEVERELNEFSNIHTLDADALRSITRNTRMVEQFFVIDKENVFLFPPESGELSGQEREFLGTARELELPLVLRAGAGEATEGIETAGAGTPGGAGTVGAGAPEGAGTPGVRGAETAGAVAGVGRWYTWFENEGVHFIYWRAMDNGYRTGAVIDRIAFISGILGALPDSDLTDNDEYASRVVLTDARGDVLYQWGLHTPADNEKPVAVTALSQPFAAWRLNMYFDVEDGVPFFVRYGALLPGIAAGVIILILLSMYFYREQAKVVADATQKVSFVNQVSHELRTPLTNIRLYTELLDNRITDEKDRARLQVVLSESRRLSRMIANVLTFSKNEKNTITINSSEVVIDELIARVVETFAVILESKSVEVSLSLKAPSRILTDGDCVEQILSNLIGNVVKYAVDGGYLGIESVQGGDSTAILVKDKGPGIPQGERKRIFEPFYRISNKLNDGVSGTGIGLSVSRAIAQKLGGSLTLERSGAGAVFKLEIPNKVAGGTV